MRRDGVEDMMVLRNKRVSWYTLHPMIASLRGTVIPLHPGLCIVEVNNVGYRVFVPMSDWEQLANGGENRLWTFTYVREDRLDLFGFLDRSTLTLFEQLIELSGIGPKTALELCAVPRNILTLAIQTDDFKILTQVKGIGKKTAEKLLLELKGMAEKHPEIFQTARGEQPVGSNVIDHDAIEALKNLGFTTPTILRALQDLPPECDSTESRVTAALRSL